MLIKSKTRYLNILSLIIVTTLVYSWITFKSPYSIGPKEAYISPDEATSYLFIENFANKNSLKLYPELNKSFDGLIHPRQAVYNGTDVVPRKFPIFYLVYGYIFRVVGATIFNYINFIIGFFIVISVYFLFIELFNQSIGFLTALVSIFSYPVLYISQRKLFAAVPATLFLIVGFTFLSRWFFHTKKKVCKILSYILAILFLSISIGLRIDYASFILFFMFYFFLRDLKLFKKKLFYLILVLFLTLIPTIIVNKYYYGGIFKTGYSFKSNTISSSYPSLNSQDDSLEKSNFIFLGLSKVKRISSNLDIILLNILSIAQNSIGIPIVVCIFLWFLRFRNEINSPSNKKYLLFLLLLFIFYCGMYLTYEKKDLSIKRSYNRYFLPFYIFFSYVSAYFLTLYENKKTRLLISFTFILLLIVQVDSMILQGNNSLQSLNNYKQSYSAFKKNLDQNVPSGSLFFTDKLDKLLVPQYKVSFLVDEKKLGISKEVEIAQLASKYIANNYKDAVYIFYTNNALDLQLLESELKRYQLFLQEENFYAGLYKIQALSEL